MNYDAPELRERLAAEYVLGTMPVLSRRRFERLLVSDPALRVAVADWNRRFDPIDEAMPGSEPPARVWQAIERRLALSPAPKEVRSGWFGSLAFWRAGAFAAAAVAAAALLYIAVQGPTPTATNVVAILSDDKGAPAWIALRGARGDIAVAPIRKVALDASHAFELWAIAAGTPHPLGLLAAEPGHPLMVQAALVPRDGALAVSIEPAGGSPSGLPTGPVPYKGAVLPPEQ